MATSVRHEMVFVSDSQSWRYEHLVTRHSKQKRAVTSLTGRDRLDDHCEDGLGLLAGSLHGIRHGAHILYVAGLC